MKRVGILTFHCADNYGAMLQAYALINFLREKNVDAEIVRYEPPFMTGRHWWIPYVPQKDLKSVLYNACVGWLRNLKRGIPFFVHRICMGKFRKKYLIRKGQRKLFFCSQLKKMAYQYYIVGSDQIWNPDITLGLKKAYFGAFRNKKTKKVIAYAASLGNSSLIDEYNQDFSRLINCVDVVSVREGAAIPYIRQFYERDIVVMLDPVFLLEQKEWIKIEKLPEKTGYIFVYMPEINEELISCAKRLAKEKGLLIVRVESKVNVSDDIVWADYAVGPEEFLGYIHKADYVITNSFHGVAFSIIYQKNFMAFRHSSTGERIRNILAIYELEDRLYHRGEFYDIDREIAWDMVKKVLEEKVKLAEKFLLENLK